MDKNNQLLVLKIVEELIADITDESVSKAITNLSGVKRGITNDIIDRLKKLMDEGQKLQAVKLYKDITGEGLIESKHFVESLV